MSNELYDKKKKNQQNFLSSYWFRLKFSERVLQTQFDCVIIETRLVN
jgi:hypothetical protein